MLIHPELLKNHRSKSRYQHADKEHHHFDWGPERQDAKSSINKEVHDAYKSREEDYVPLRIHWAIVAVARDLCITDSDSIKAWPLQVFHWYGKKQYYTYYKQVL